MLAELGKAADAQARPRTRVQWTEVTLPTDERQAQRENQLRAVLRRESHHADWGSPPGDFVEASLHVTEFSIEHRPDVVRVTCSAVGRLHKGPMVRTHFSFGGNPKKRDALEQTMLTLVGRGVVTRLAAVSRTRSPAGHERSSLSR